MEKIKYPNKAGVYKLTCIKNDKVYIGKSVYISARISRHKNSKITDKNRKWHLQNAIIKHGWDSFKVEILEIFNDFDKRNEDHKRLILEKEAHYIELFDSTNREKGYNKCKFSTDCTGTVCSEETRAKLRKAHLGKKMSPEAIEKTRQANLGRKNSDASKEKMRLAHLGKTCSEETREKMRNKTFSEETRKKISEARKGKPKSKEHIEKVRQANIGRKHSEETKEKMRQAKLNKQKLNQNTI